MKQQEANRKSKRKLHSKILKYKENVTKVGIKKREKDVKS